MEFKNISIEELNKELNLNLKLDWNCNGDFYQELNNQLEENKSIDYYFTSFDGNDVIEDLNETTFIKENCILYLVENVYIVIV